MSESNPKIYFLRVKDAKAKLARLYRAVEQQFLGQKNLVIQVPDQKVADYIDNLLWGHQAESFLPHEVSDSISLEKVVITTTKSNPNKATVLLNLCPQAAAKCSEYTVVYELFDETSPEKERLSLQRQGQYQSIGYAVNTL